MDEKRGTLTGDKWLKYDLTAIQYELLYVAAGWDEPPSLAIIDNPKQYYNMKIGFIYEFYAVFSVADEGSS